MTHILFNLQQDANVRFALDAFSPPCHTSNVRLTRCLRPSRISSLRGTISFWASAEVSPWVEPPLLEGQLWFGSVLVADLHRMSPHQGTWFSECDLRISRGQGELQGQLLTYIAFCEDFYRRIAEGGDHDFDEFERFTTIPNCELWSARLPSGRIVPMERMIWFADGDVIWQHPETETSTEAAANQFWMQNAPNTQKNHGKAEQVGGGQPATRPESKWPS